MASAPSSLVTFGSTLCLPGMSGGVTFCVSRILVLNALFATKLTRSERCWRLENLLGENILGYWLLVCRGCFQKLLQSLGTLPLVLAALVGRMYIIGVG